MIDWLRICCFALVAMGGSSAWALGGDFALTRDDGKTYHLSDSHGHVVVLSFGYTFCPDVCPTALATISAALKSLGERAEEVDAFFVTLDPERDSTEKLRSYTQFFHARLHGLTGTAEDIAEIAERYKVRYRFVGKGTSEYYTLDHSASTYVVDRNGKLTGIIPHGVPPTVLADAIDTALNQPSQ